MKKKLFLTTSGLALAILLVAIALMAHFTSPPAEAAATSVVVYHRNIYGTNVATSGTISITVEARVWPGGNWVDITNTAISYATCGAGTYAWKYTWNPPDDVSPVEFRVTVQQGKSGTKCSGGATSYVSEDVLNKIVINGQTGSITAGWYYP